MASERQRARTRGPSVRPLLLVPLLLLLLPLLHLAWATPVVVDSRTAASASAAAPATTINAPTTSSHYQHQHHHHPTAARSIDDEESFNPGAPLEQAAEARQQPRISRSPADVIHGIHVKQAVVQHEEEDGGGEEEEDDDEDEGESVFGSALPIAEKLVLEQHRPAAQKLYPAFFRNIPPLGHSRPYYQPPIDPSLVVEQQQQQQQQPPRYSNKIRQHAVPVAGAAIVPVPEAVPAAAALPALLGSGDFGVIKGGTFYYDSDVPGKGGGSSSFLDEFYRLGYAGGNNGHGRPQQLGYLLQAAKAPLGAPKEEQFSNFRDFADINISNDPAYSHRAPQYAPAPAPAANHHSQHHREPDNILDELRSLDQLPAAAKKRPKSDEASSQRGSRSTHPGDNVTTLDDDYMMASS